MKLTLAAHIDWLFGTQMYGVKLGLENMRGLAALLGLSKPASVVLHVAGTNGKGSVCAFADRIARAGGWRSGLFTSPHLVSFRERIQIDGEMVDEAALVEVFELLRERLPEMEVHPTFFEITTALAWMIFEKAKLDVVVLETGLGGRLDATNVLESDVCGLTPVSLDHMAQLGNTLGEIAFEKAGILKACKPAFSLPQKDEVREVFEAVAKEVGALISFELPEIPQDWRVGLQGEFQRQNASLALAMLKAAGWPGDEAAARGGIEQVQLEARFQRLGPNFIVDGAHNPAAAAELVLNWQATFPGRKANLIFGVLADKDPRAVLAILRPIVGSADIVGLENPRSARPCEVAELAAEELEPGTPIRWDRDLEALLSWVRSGETRPTLATGSFFLAGEILRFYQHAAKESLIPASQ